MYRHTVKTTVCRLTKKLETDSVCRLTKKLETVCRLTKKLETAVCWLCVEETQNSSSITNIRLYFKSTQTIKK
jgi:hypothetical protein